MSLENRNYEGEKLTVDTSMIKGGKYRGLMNGEPVTIEPDVFHGLAKWSGRPLLPPEQKRVRRWVSLKPALWAAVDKKAGTHSQAIEEILNKELIK